MPIAKGGRPGTARTAGRTAGRSADAGRTAVTPKQAARTGFGVAHSDLPTGPDVHLLDVPYPLRDVASGAGARWHKAAKAYVYEGKALPESLRPFASRPYSLERWREETLRGLDAPGPSGIDLTGLAPITLRPHQEKARLAILEAADAGRSGILEADDVGVGKTAPAIVAAFDLEPETVLVVAPLHALAHWRSTIARVGDRGIRIVLINYDRLAKICEAPDFVPRSTSKRSRPRRIRTLKGKARHGVAIPFSTVIIDECHKARNPDAARSKFVAKITAAADFTIWMSATAGQNPLELSYLAGLLCEQTGDRASDLREFEDWCKRRGFSVARAKYGRWSWGETTEGEVDRAARDRDLVRMRDLLFAGTPPLGIRRTPSDIAGWPEIQRIPVPIALGAEDAIAYQALWDAFRREQGLSKVSKDGGAALTAQLRFRQKASLLRTQGTVDYALDMLEQGFSVAISVQFIETLGFIAEALRSKGHAVCEIHGALTPEDKERERLAFQRGEARVCLYTVVDAISLHQGELDPADDRRRISLIHDGRWSAIEMKQIEGRTHRDGKPSDSIILYAEGTIEEHVARVVCEKLRDTGVMMGDGEIVAQIEDVMETFARRHPSGLAT